MEQIGEKSRFFSEGSLKPIDYTPGERPEALPPLGPDESVYAGVDNGNGEVIYLLEPGQAALPEVQQLSDSQKAGTHKKVTFYLG